jgi:hypothetical protein
MHTTHHPGINPNRAPAPQAATPVGTLSDAEIRQIIREVLG